MKVKSLAVLFAVLFLFGVSLVWAEEKFGVKVYDGAKFDGETTNFLKQISPEAAAYRTNDSAEKIIDFYKKQPGLKLMGATKEGGMFKKGPVDITIQNPWMDMKTGKMMKDTLISIVKQKE